jgi:hypothetical protein
MRGYAMLNQLIDWLAEHCARLPDLRQPSPNRQYSVSDAALSAFSVFFMQSPSFLATQRDMQRTKGRNNAQSLFAVPQIPSDNQIRNILDPIAPSHLSKLFWQVYEQLPSLPGWAQHRGVAGHLLCALDGVQYHSSRRIHCAHCTRWEQEHGTLYTHSMIAPVLVAPASATVFSLEPEFVQPQDGHSKQDCEQQAIQRWLARNATHLPAGRTTILTDDLHCHQPLMERLREHGFNFILVCLPDSHETLYREVDLLAGAGLLESVSERRWNGRFEERLVYRFTNQVPVRAGLDALLVNWCELTIWHSQTGEQLYQNAFATDFVLTAQNVAQVVGSGRARWKTENENFNTLKNRGYHLEHNFGHGKQNLSALLATLNLLAFLFHTLMWLTEPVAQQLRTELGTLMTFWDDVRTLTRYFYFPTWAQLFQFMAAGLDLAPPP